MKASLNQENRRNVYRRVDFILHVVSEGAASIDVIADCAIEVDCHLVRHMVISYILLICQSLAEVHIA